jgi:membrane fusion protein (multidrug efflux system)
MKKSILIGGIIALAALAVLAGIKVMQIRTLMAGGAHEVPPEAVASATVKEESWQRTLTAIGSVTPVQGVNVSVELNGTVQEIAFESGAKVAEGDLLVRMDTSTEEAQLRALEAQADLARINAERARKLRADNTLSESELDSAEATFKQAQANADAVRAVIAKKTIRAPFAGRLGIRQVMPGQYLEAGKPIVSLQALDTVYVDFSLPQQELAQLRPGMGVRVISDTYPTNVFRGELTSLNPALNASTRSVQLQATLANPGHLLRPGMFVRAEVLLSGDQHVVTIPATAVFRAPYGDSVYLIEASTNSTDGLVVRQQFIRTGQTRGDYVSVEAGLKPGQRVVSAGLFKLRNGISVVEQNDIVPKADTTPHPPNT